MAGELLNSTDVSGILPIANGGTNRSTGFAGLTALAGSVNPIANTYLKVNSTNTGLTYDAIALNSTDVSGILPIANGGTGSSTGGGMIKAWATWSESSAGFTSVSPAGFNVSSITKSSATGTTRIVNFDNPITGSYAVLVSGDINNDAGDIYNTTWAMEAARVNNNSCAVMWYASNASGVPTTVFNVVIIQ